MSINFWKTLPKPFFILAPMADVTDAAFRRVIAKYGKPDAIYTEFVSADGLMSAGRERLLHDLAYTESERPIVAQLFSGKPEVMEQAAALVAELGFDGLDINMGCPDRSIEKQLAGAALCKDYPRAQEIIRAAKRGIASSGREMPVSVKIRIGYNKNEIEIWLPALLEAEPAAVIIHARTRKEMSRVPAHWDVVKRAVEIRDKQGSETLIVGNGDVRDLADAREKAAQYGCDGVMLGRAIFGNPWLFANLAREERGCQIEHLAGALAKEGECSQAPTIEEKLRVLVEHTKLYEELLGGIKSFAVMKKHYKAYVEGFEGAKDLRAQLMEAENVVEVEKIIEEWFR